MNNAWNQVPEDMIKKSFITTGIIRERWDIYYNQPENRHLIHSQLRPVLFQEIPPDVDLGDSESVEEETINYIGRFNVT